LSRDDAPRVIREFRVSLEKRSQFFNLDVGRVASVHGDQNLAHSRWKVLRHQPSWSLADVYHRSARTNG
jgi:hypothetical protein